VNPDFLIIGAGIVGLALARELKRRYPDQQVTILEKEPAPGRHASGRNSGVLHSGIYYPPGTLKARVCAQGAVELAAYCQERQLPFTRPGKLLVPVQAADAPQLDLLQARAQEHGIPVTRLPAADLQRLEPEVRSATGEALLVPGTAVVAPTAVLEALSREVQAAGVTLLTGGHLDRVDPARQRLTWSGTTLNYGHAINCAGAHADTVAHQFGAGQRYTLLPFRGAYYQLDPRAGIRVQHLIYPVPDLRVPFLGVHTTTSVTGDVYLGPTATPAFGRESYRGLHGTRPAEAARIAGLLGRQYLAGRDGFRRLAWQEAARMTQRGFAAAAQALLPRLQVGHLLPADKVGIRAQMLDRQTGRLVMDFLVEQSPGATHVLNAISPAFTSSFPLARHLIDEFIAR
jgi:L-2-hydroxyglutarate oxidase LhgO